MKDVFIGPALHWALLVAVVVALYAMGAGRLHTAVFNLFSAVLLLLVAVVVTVVLATYREGQRITREPQGETGPGGSDRT